MDNAQKILVVIIVLAIIGTVGYFVVGVKDVQNFLNTNSQNKTDKTQLEDKKGEMQKGASRKTQKLIDSIKQKAQESPRSGFSEGIVTLNKGEGTSSATTTAISAGEGSDYIELETGQVINRDGENVNEAATSEDENPPSQSLVVDEEDIPEEAVQLHISPNNIKPAQFTVTPGQAVLMSVTAGEATEIFRFKSEKLAGVKVGVAPGKTRTISFNAPQESGEYVYYSSMADHESRGAKGKMIVE